MPSKAGPKDYTSAERGLADIPSKHIGGILGSVLIITFRDIITGIYWDIRAISMKIEISSPKVIERNSSKRYRDFICPTVNDYPLYTVVI